MFAIMAGLFYFASLIMQSSFDPNTGNYGWNPQDIFTALFSIFYGANAAGTAFSAGPDLGKA